MPYGNTITWSVSYGTGYSNTLSDVQSLSVFQGRQYIADPFDASTATIECRNISAWSATKPRVKRPIKITATVSGLFTATVFNGYISDVQINYGLTTDLDTATIRCEGILARWGRRTLSAESLSQLPTGSQASSASTALGLTMIQDPGRSIAAAQTYTGNALDYLNTVSATEVGRLVQTGDTVYFFQRNVSTAITETFTDLTGSGNIKYDVLRFKSAAEDYYSRVRIEPLGLAAQTSSSGSAPYYELVQSSYDYNTTQAKAHADYLLGLFAERDSMPSQISALWEMQTSDGRKADFFNLMSDIRQLNRSVSIAFRSSVYYCITEGTLIEATPNETRLTINLSGKDLNAALIWSGESPYGEWDNNDWTY